jgi:serine/threonine protein kinase
MALPFGKYQLLKKLAAGGMGQVFLARAGGAQGFEKMLVIKRILPHLVEDEEFLSMFFDEARLTARLNHPNIVQIFELGEAEGSHYLAMEYVAGEDLRRVDREARSQGKAFPLGAICRIISDAAAGLDYAHKAHDGQGNPLNLIHRDVSPQNVLVGFDGGVKLIDFGVAKAAGRMQHTATGILKGKYAYMSPEQVDGLPIDHRSDIFALGVVFWEVLAGKRLFKGDSDVVTMRLVRECKVDPPSTINSAVPPALDPIVQLALARDPARRYPDAAAFRMAIEDFIVAERLSASSAHLVTFLRDIYAERIAQEHTPASFDELAPTDVLDEVRTPASKVTGMGAARGVKVGGAAREGTKAVEETTTSRRIRVGGLIVAALVVIGLGLGFGIPKLLKKDPTSLKPDQLLVERHDPPPPPALPEKHAVMLVTDPLHARVQVDGADIGSTPVMVNALANAAPMKATFILDGYETGEATISDKTGPELTIQLKKKVAVNIHKNGNNPPAIKTGR